MTYSDARARFKDVMDRAIHDNEEIIVTRRKSESVVVLSLDAWNSIKETMYLLSSPRNAERLRTSIVQLDAGKASERDLIE